MVKKSLAIDYSASPFLAFEWHHGHPIAGLGGGYWFWSITWRSPWQVKGCQVHTDAASGAHKKQKNMHFCWNSCLHHYFSGVLCYEIVPFRWVQLPLFLLLLHPVSIIYVWWITFIHTAQIRVYHAGLLLVPCCPNPRMMSEVGRPSGRAKSGSSNII